VNSVGCTTGSTSGEKLPIFFAMSKPKKKKTAKKKTTKAGAGARTGQPADLDGVGKTRLMSIA